MRILIAWELGANFGHLARSLPVADRLRERGEQLAFAVRDTCTAGRFPGRRFPFLQAPLPACRRRRAAPASHAEILLADGWHDADALYGSTLAWLNLFALAAADGLVADHAPGALLAARIAGLPAVVFGSGFEVPPASGDAPCLRPWEDIAAARIAHAEAVALAAANTVLRRLGGPPLVALRELYPAGPLLATYPELDHFGPRGDARYLGSIHSLAGGTVAHWPEGAGARVFAYLRAEQRATADMLDALAACGASAVCVVPDASPELLCRHAGSSITILRQPVQAASLLGEADAAVSYGGAGTIAECLLAGTPLLLVPQVAEQYLGAQRACALGAARLVGRERSPAILQATLTALIEDGGAQRAAKAFAARYAGETPERAAARAAAAIVERLVDARSSLPECQT